jgi:CRP/FNR family transcriptional regulator
MNHLTNQNPNRSTINSCVINPNTFVVRSGECLFRMQDELEGIYMINSGTVKLSRVSESGDEQIVGFYMSGDLIGLDALADGASHSTATLLETSNITLIPFKTLESGSGEFDYSTFIHQIGRSFNRESEHAMMLSQCTAGRRISWFLISLSDAMAKRGLQPAEFIMAMKRCDIARFLGMAIETVSRELTRLCEKNLIKKNRRHIELLDIDTLRKTANGDDDNWTFQTNDAKHSTQTTYSH